jgi:hypothetical protein
MTLDWGMPGVYCEYTGVDHTTISDKAVSLIMMVTSVVEVLRSKTK